jgi:hypothetical protein
MSPDPSQPKINLNERFPKMRPVKRTPTLVTINGFGASVYGRRDEDPETGAYVKTHCFCALFIPLIALGAYRVVDGPDRSWYFLGKEPLSIFAKLWNGFVLSLVLVGTGGIAWNSYVSSPEYVARQELSAGQSHLKSGNALKAAETFSKLIVGSSVSVEARQGLQIALEQCLQSSSARTNAGAFQVLVRLGAEAKGPSPLVPDAYPRGLALIQKHRSQDPEAALQLLDAVSALEPKDEALPALRISLLKQAIMTQPGNTNRVIQLALAYEKASQPDEGGKVLLPYRTGLGSTEGARILGQYLLRENQHDDAYSLLYPYVQARLQKLHALERSYTNAVSASYNAALEHLRKGRAQRSFYDAYEKASKSEQGAMVESFVEKWMQNDATYKRALTQLTEANQIVHVTLDLGIVQLNRAQGFTDAAARKAELEAAEKTFLAIRGLAGETDEYRLFLGQVYYWLGKSKEGKELFDQLLASRKRSYPILMALGRTLREVGEEKQAREILEEAYRVGKAGEEKSGAAGMRAVIAKDIADKIVWLEKTDTTQVEAQIALNNARGEQALEQGNKERAAEFLRKAIAGYESLTRTSTSLNNAGLAYLSLYEATGRAEDHHRGVALLEQAVALAPGNSILLINTTQILISRAIMDVVRDSFRLDLLKETPSYDLLPYLYNTEQERNALFDRLRNNESMKKALAYLDKALLLAPKTRGLYQEQLFFQSAFQDLGELQKLQQRLRAADLDPAEARKEARLAFSGAKDMEYLEKYQPQLKKYEGLLQSPAVQQHPLTLAYVSSTLNNLKQNAALYGAKVDSRQLLDSAVAVTQKHNSSAGTGSLIAALYFRAADELSVQNSEFAAFAKRSSRSLSPKYLVAFSLDRGGPLADAVRQNANVQKALALEKEQGRRFPKSRGADEWALFRATDANEAELVARTFKDNAIAQLVDELHFQLSPGSGSAVLDQYWTRRMFGEDKRADAIYEEAVQQGLPLLSLPRNAASARARGGSTEKLVDKD